MSAVDDFRADIRRRDDEIARLRELLDAAQEFVHGQHAYVHGDCEHMRPLEAALSRLAKGSAAGAWADLQSETEAVDGDQIV